MDITSNELPTPTTVEAKILVLSTEMFLVGYIAYTIVDNLTVHPLAKFQPIPAVIMFIVWVIFAETLFVTALRISLRSQELIWHRSTFKLLNIVLKNTFTQSKTAWWRVVSPSYLKLSANTAEWSYKLVSKILQILIVCALCTLVFDLVNMVFYVFSGESFKI